MKELSLTETTEFSHMYIKTILPPIRNSNTTRTRTDLEKDITFGAHLKTIFQPCSSELEASQDECMFNELNVPQQTVFPIKKVPIQEIIKIEINF